MISYTFDSRDRVISKTDALSNVETYAYDPAGGLEQRIDRKGQVTGWVYDGLHRVTEVGYGAAVNSPGAYVSTVTKTWDAGNRLTQINDSRSGAIARTYDGLDRLIQETTGQGVVTYTYDAGGRRTSMTVQGQPAISYVWDAANRLTQIQQAAGGSNGNVLQTVAFQYDAGNRRTQITYPSGVTASYGYDNSNQLVSITYAQSNGAVIGTLTYGYDLGGRRTTVGGTMANASLPGVSGVGTYNANNEVTGWNGASYSYDANGNLVSDSTQTYSWNERNQLVGLSGSTPASFVYDGTGRRIGKTVGGVSTGYVYDRTTFVQELSGVGSGATVNANLLTGNTDETFLRETSAGINALLTDALGSTVAELGSAQQSLNNYQYDAYGNTSQTGAQTGNSQQYTGRESDGTGLYYYRARYYNPTTGRFISEDPEGWASRQSNNYIYAGGDPVNFDDPYGLWTWRDAAWWMVGLWMWLNGHNPPRPPPKPRRPPTSQSVPGPPGPEARQGDPPTPCPAPEGDPNANPNPQPNPQPNPGSDPDGLPDPPSPPMQNTPNPAWYLLLLLPLLLLLAPVGA